MRTIREYDLDVAAPGKFRLKDDHLRRWLAGDVSARGLARELGVSDTAVRNRLASSATAKRLSALQPTHENPAQTRPAPSKGNPISPKKPVAEALSSEGWAEPVVTRVKRHPGGVGDYSFAGAGRPGELGHFGYLQSSRAVEYDEPARVTVSDGVRAFTFNEGDPEIERYEAKGFRVHR